MTGWWFGSGVRNQLRCHDDLDSRLEGIHRHIAGVYLLRYAQERSWRGTTAVCRTVSKSTPRSFVFEAWQVSGFWWLSAAALERYSCLSKSFTPTKKSIKIMSPV